MKLENTALILIAAGLLLAPNPAPALDEGATFSQAAVEQLPGQTRTKDLFRQLALLVPTVSVPGDATLRDNATLRCFVQTGLDAKDKEIKNSKWNLNVQIGSIAQTGLLSQITTYDQTSKTDAEGLLTWEVPLFSQFTDPFLAGLYGVVVYEIQGKNPKKIDNFAAGCHVNFREPCVEDGQTACLGGGRFQVRAHAPAQRFQSSGLEAVFFRGTTDLDLKIVLDCRDGNWVTGDVTGGTDEIQVDVQDLFNGTSLSYSSKEPVRFLSVCF